MSKLVKSPRMRRGLGQGKGAFEPRKSGWGYRGSMVRVGRASFPMICMVWVAQERCCNVSGDDVWPRSFGDRVRSLYGVWVVDLSIGCDLLPCRGHQSLGICTVYFNSGLFLFQMGDQDSTRRVSHMKFSNSSSDRDALPLLLINWPLHLHDALFQVNLV